MIEEFVIRVVPRGYRNRGQTIETCSLDIERRVTDHANAVRLRARALRTLAQDGPRLLPGMRDHVAARLKTIAESAEGEPGSQSGILDLEPANLFEIAGSDTQQ